MSIENGNQAHEAQNDSYDAWQNMASEIRQEAATKSYSEARREGNLPEYIRDEQDYKEWQAEQDAKKSESLKKDQEIFNQVRNIEDSTDRDFATACLGSLYDNDKSMVTMHVIIEYVNQDDKSGNLSDFVKDYVEENPQLERRQYGLMRLDDIRQIKKIANNPEEHVEGIVDAVDSLGGEMAWNHANTIFLGEWFNPESVKKNPEAIYFVEQEINRLETATDDIEKYEAATGVNVALKLLQGKSFDRLRYETFEKAAREYRNNIRSDFLDNKQGNAPRYIIEMNEISNAEEHFKSTQNFTRLYDLYLKKGKKLLETAAR